MQQFIVLIYVTRCRTQRTRVNGEGRLVTTSSLLGSGLMNRMNQDSPISIVHHNALNLKRAGSELTLGDAVLGRQESLLHQTLQDRPDGRPVDQL